MKRLLALAVLLAGCGPETFTVVTPAPGSSTSLPLVVEDNRPRVEVLVNGKPVWLLVDTGAEATIWLEHDAAVEVGALFTGTASMYSDAYGHTFRACNYELEECRLGDIVLRNVQGRECARSEPGIRGILGWRLLEKFRVLLDYPGKRMTLGLPDGVSTEGWTRIPFRATSWGIVTEATCDGKAAEFVWDTGASRMVAKTGSVTEVVEELAVKSVVIGGRDFGPFTFVILDMSDPPGDGLVGHDFFEKHRVVIDWETSTLLVE